VQTYALVGSKVQVIHNGVRDSLFSEAHLRTAREDGKFILFSGRMVPMKNLAGTLRAFSLIKDRVPHKIVVTGYCQGNGETKLMSDLVDQCSVERNRVEFKGHVSGRDMEDLLSRASLLVFPSFYEGFGLPPLEGMAHGCPVVVSKVSSLPEVCGDAAQYVDPANDSSIADGMYRMLTDAELRKKLIARGIGRAKQFRWRHSALKHLDLFDQAMFEQERGKSRVELNWRIGNLLQTHPLLAVVASSLFRHQVR